MKQEQEERKQKKVSERYMSERQRERQRESGEREGGKKERERERESKQGVTLAEKGYWLVEVDPLK